VTSLITYTAPANAPSASRVERVGGPHEVEERPPHERRGARAEHVGEPRVRVHDPPCRVHRADPLVRRLHEPAVALLALPQRGLGTLAVRHADEPWGELARLLLLVTPHRLARRARATGGSEAVDPALRAAMTHTRRRRFLSLDDSYHGNTVGALSVGESR
jgi:hypothetical protein